MLDPQNLILSYNWTLRPFDQHFLISPIPQPLATTILLSVSRVQLFKDSLYK